MAAALPASLPYQRLIDASAESDTLALLPLFAKSILHAGPFGLGVLRSMVAVGALVAGVPQLLSGTIDRVTLHRVTREREDDDPRLAVRILDGEGRLVAEAAPSALPFRARALDATRVEVSLAHPVHLVGGSVYQLQVSVHGGTLTLSGAAIAQEGAWNDSVPMRVPWPAPGAFEVGPRAPSV